MKIKQVQFFLVIFNKIYLDLSNIISLKNETQNNDLVNSNFKLYKSYLQVHSKLGNSFIMSSLLDKDNKLAIF